MADENVIVGFVQQIDPPILEPAGEGLLPPSPRRAVHFTDRTVYLDAQTPKCARKMTMSPVSRVRPLFVGVRKRGNYEAITIALLPVVTTVTRITPLPGGAMAVDLESSSAPHVLRPSAGDFTALQDSLYHGCDIDETLVVTGSLESYEILDVRKVTSLQLEAVAHRDPPRDEIIRELPAVTLARAQELFDLVMSANCDPNAPEPGCIPFLFPYDGCFARADRACELMRAAGTLSAKVWVYGSYLTVATPDSRTCEVSWRYHAAAALRAADTGEDDDLYVIDPSMCNAPLREATWLDLIGPRSDMRLRRATAFLHGRDPYHPDEAEQWLEGYRTLLYCHSKKFGAPPYARCAPRECATVDPRTIEESSGLVDETEGAAHKASSKP